MLALGTVDRWFTSLQRAAEKGATKLLVLNRLVGREKGAGETGCGRKAKALGDQRESSP